MGTSMAKTHRNNDGGKQGKHGGNKNGESGKPQKPEKEVIAKPVRHHGDPDVPDYRHSKRERLAKEAAAEAAAKRRELIHEQAEARDRFLKQRELDAAADLESLTALARNGKCGTFAVRGEAEFLILEVSRDKGGHLIALPVKVGVKHRAATAIQAMIEKKIRLQLRFVFSGIKFLPEFLRPFEAGLVTVANQLRKELEKHGLAEVFKETVKKETAKPKTVLAPANAKGNGDAPHHVTIPPVPPASVHVPGSQAVH